eukprot:612788-Prymnesium_polylepis.1
MVEDAAKKLVEDIKSEYRTRRTLPRDAHCVLARTDRSRCPTRSYLKTLCFHGACVPRSAMNRSRQRLCSGCAAAGPITCGLCH